MPQRRVITVQPVADPAAEGLHQSVLYPPPSGAPCVRATTCDRRPLVLDAKTCEYVLAGQQEELLSFWDALWPSFLPLPWCFPHDGLSEINSCGLILGVEPDPLMGDQEAAESLTKLRRTNEVRFRWSFETGRKSAGGENEREGSDWAMSWKNTYKGVLTVVDETKSTLMTARAPREHTRLTTILALDTQGSGYEEKFREWCDSHKDRDVETRFSRTETLCKRIGVWEGQSVPEGKYIIWGEDAQDLKVPWFLDWGARCALCAVGGGPCVAALIRTRTEDAVVTIRKRVSGPVPMCEIPEGGFRKPVKRHIDWEDKKDGENGADDGRNSDNAESRERRGRYVRSSSSSPKDGGEASRQRPSREYIERRGHLVRSASPSPKEGRIVTPKRGAKRISPKNGVRVISKEPEPVIIIGA